MSRENIRFFKEPKFQCLTGECKSMTGDVFLRPSQHSVENGLSCMKIILKKIFWRSRDSNPRPFACEANTLPLSYTPISYLIHQKFQSKLKIFLSSFYNEFSMGLFQNTYLTKKVIKPFLKSLVGPILFDRNFMSSFFLSKNVTYFL